MPSTASCMPEPRGLPAQGAEHGDQAGPVWGCSFQEWFLLPWTQWTFHSSPVCVSVPSWCLHLDGAPPHNKNAF